MMLIIKSTLVLFSIQCLLKNALSAPNFLNIPYLDILKGEVYVKTTEYKEVVVAYADPRTNLKPNDYISNADGKILTSTLQDFVESGENEVIVPIIDDEDSKYDGYRLLGFVSMKPHIPRKLQLRRGEIGPDFDSYDNDKMKSPLEIPSGGGACITNRDCFNGLGSCDDSKCKCPSSKSGSYCQLDASVVVDLQRRYQQQQQQQQQRQQETKQNLPKVDAKGNSKTSGDQDQASSPLKRVTKDNKDKDTTTSTTSSTTNKTKSTTAKTTATGKGQDKPKETAKVVEEKKKVEEPKFVVNPYNAGKVPPELVNIRAQNRVRKIGFVYAVRFRNGPIGASFDNTLQDGTRVERVFPGMQAADSDVQVGDYLIAVDSHNTSGMPARASLKIMQDLPWPRVLVFETRGALKEQETKLAADLDFKKRTANISFIYPPTMLGNFHMIMSSWTPVLPEQYDWLCPVYTLKILSDPFGCLHESGQYAMDSASRIIFDKQGTGLSYEEESRSPMLAMLTREAKRLGIQIDLRVLGVAKRGVCTFVDKAKGFGVGGAGAGLIVNNEDVLLDMPSGKEDTSSCTVPTGLISDRNGTLMTIAVMKSEVLAVMSDPVKGYSPACESIQTLAEGIIDKWVHSVPELATDTILQASQTDKSVFRSNADTGGRISISGENGWAFFDYHLAMFGPQQVPLGAHKLQMAMPPYGCDPAAYEVRIAGTIVAILRGGGCSFGSKVINAHKLGAKAVMIVNTEDKSTMRLKALPDEEPLIHIPCIMVGRRVQYYLEKMLKYYYLIDQHIVSIQPSDLIGQYDKRHRLSLPALTGVPND